MTGNTASKRPARRADPATPGRWVSRTVRLDRRRPVKLRPAPVEPGGPLMGKAGDAIRPHALACEGPHVVALIPATPGGYRYHWFRFQPVTGQWVPQAADARRDAVLSALWLAECRHAEPLGATGPRLSGPGFGLRLHSLLNRSEYPGNVARLSPPEAAAIPHGLVWAEP